MWSDNRARLNAPLSSQKLHIPETINHNETNLHILNAKQSNIYHPLTLLIKYTNSDRYLTFITAEAPLVWSC